MTRGGRRQLGAIDRMPSGRWRVRLLDPSTSRRVSVGTFRTKAEAETAFARALSDQGQGAWVAPDQGRLTLGEYATGWLGSRLTARGEPLRPRVRELYESELRLHILPTLGAVPLGRMTTVTIRRWHAGLPRGRSRTIDGRQVLPAVASHPQHRRGRPAFGRQPVLDQGRRHRDI